MKDSQKENATENSSAGKPASTLLFSLLAQTAFQNFKGKHCYIIRHIAGREIQADVNWAKWEDMYLEISYISEFKSLFIASDKLLMHLKSGHGVCLPLSPKRCIHCTLPKQHFQLYCKPISKALVAGLAGSAGLGRPPEVWYLMLGPRAWTVRRWRNQEGPQRLTFKQQWNENVSSLVLEDEKQVRRMASEPRV